MLDNIYISMRSYELLDSLCPNSLSLSPFSCRNTCSQKSTRTYIRTIGGSEFNEATTSLMSRVP